MGVSSTILYGNCIEKNQPVSGTGHHKVVLKGKYKGQKSSFTLDEEMFLFIFLIITMPVLMKSFQILWVRCVNLHLQSLLGLDMQLLSFPRRWGYLFRRNMTRL